MATLATAAMVIEAGSLRYELFEGLTGNADLTALVNRWLKVADAWIKRRAPDAYVDPDESVQTLLSQGECFLTLAYLGAQAKARKVFGTHYSFDSEDSDRYDNPLETEWRTLAMELLDEFLEVETPGVTYALPYFAGTVGVDYTLEATFPEVDLEDDLARSRGIAAPDPVQVVGP